MNVSVDQLAALQQRQARIRNLCVLAHVDHGKTTLSDHLIASNGLIHPKLVGELRYLDSRDDEQARGITMKSSSISLLYVPGAAMLPEGPKSCSDEDKVRNGFLINLIDSPGHVDFCSEVSTATRLSDGALVLVDAVEGVCIQTHAVLRQAWEEKVKPCLVINKLDRLILELRLTPAEAYARLQAIVSHCNMIMSAFQSESFMQEADAVLAYEEQRQAAYEASRANGDATSQHDNGHDDAADADEEDTFDPCKGNVAFSSAHDGWGFRLQQFADMYAEKLGAKPEALVRALWGEYAFQPKEKRVVRIRRQGEGKLKPMFVQFVLEPLWKAYSVCDQGEDVQAILGQIIKGRGLRNITQRALDHPEPRQALRAVLRAWLPLSEALLSMAASCLPSPAEAAPTRAPRLLGPRATTEGIAAAAAAAAQQLPSSDTSSTAASAADDVVMQLERMRTHVHASSSSADAPLVIYVSKMVSVPMSVLPRRPGDKPPADATAEVFLAFGRVFSGVAREGARVHVLSAAYDPAAPQQQRQTAVLSSLYLMMGRALEQLPAVPAGNVLAMAGLETAILKSATLSSSPCALPLAPMVFQAAPIVRVAVEPAHPSDMARLAEGLRLLNRADPFVEVSLLETGEHLLGAAGEVHLETCVKDLKERFAKVELQVSAPIVAFRESVALPGEGSEASSTRSARVVEAQTPSGCCTVRVKAHALPGALASVLDTSAELLRGLLLERGAAAALAALPAATGDAGAAAAALATANAGYASTGTAGVRGNEGTDQGDVAAFRDKLRSICADSDDKGVPALLSRAWLLGPKRTGPNMLLASGSATCSSGSGSSSYSGGGLFEVPASQVVRAGRMAKGMGVSASAPTAAPSEAQPAALEMGQRQEAQQLLQHLDLPVGQPLAAAMLGLSIGSANGTTSNTTSSSHPANGSAGSPSHSNGAASSTAIHVPSTQEWHHARQSIESGVVAGFQLATAAGPLCDEPMWGVAFELEVRLSAPAAASSGGMSDEGTAEGQFPSLDLQEDVFGPFSGQVMTAVATACRRAVLDAEPRLVEALYLCQVQAQPESLAGVYAVLSRRRSQVLREELREGSDQFIVHAYLPVEASFGLADEMRRKSSGGVSASLLLSHWARLPVDPFWVPTTEEEREEWGDEGASVANLARRLIDAVRRRKGLPVEEKVVAKATKQRTLKRNV